MTTIVYLHGFRSSPASIKATQLRDYVAAMADPPQLHIPDLTHRPEMAIVGVLDWVEHHADRNALTFIGTSIGG